MTYLALAVAFLATAMIVSAILAWDGHRSYLAQRDRERVFSVALEKMQAELAAHTSAFEEHRAANRNLMIDWKKKFDQLQGEWKELEQRARGQYAGALAQAESLQTGNGWGR